MTLKKDAAGEFIFRNPKWTTTDTIEVEVEHETFGWIPFNATPYDDESYGQELFELLSVTYADQVEACPESAYYEEAVYLALKRRNAELVASDWTQLPDVPQDTKDLWAVYRQALRDITDQEGYPFEIVWPVSPASNTTGN